MARTIRLCLPCPDPRPGSVWGDWYFTQSLAAALKKQGVDVGIAPAKRRTGGLWRRAIPKRVFWKDEIDLVIRGMKPWRKLSRRPLFIWLISQADTLENWEIDQAEHIFCASPDYTEALAKLGASASWLPQCTDARIFSPDRFTPDIKSNILFVGNRRKNFERDVVRLALLARKDVRVWGRGWEGALPEGVHRGTSVSYKELGAHYASADVVLNDHHPSMYQLGFVSNRLYDVLASGRPVLNEDMPGIPEDLESGVLRYTPDTFRDQLDRALGLDGTVHMSLAEHVRQEHSFDKRARAMLDVIGPLIRASAKPGA